MLVSCRLCFGDVRGSDSLRAIFLETCGVLNPCMLSRGDPREADPLCTISLETSGMLERSRRRLHSFY